jgi:hypothetical protein
MMIKLIILIFGSLVVFWPKPIRFRCWFSRRFWDIHDYQKEKGGDGVPSHFKTYKCWNCDQEFEI